MCCHPCRWRPRQYDEGTADYTVTCHIVEWLYVVGSIKLQVSFAKEPCKRDDILQKRPIILSSLLHSHMSHYGVATCSRLVKIIGLFCRISSLLQGSFAKQTYNFKEPTNRSHRIQIDATCLSFSLYIRNHNVGYGVATMSRMLKNTGLFAEYRSLLQSSFAKETYIFKHPTNRSHPI